MGVTMRMVGLVAIGTTFGLEGFVDLHHMQMHGAQHVGQHVVRLDFQMVNLQLDGHMSVTQVIGCTCQVEHTAVHGVVGDAQYRLRRRLHLKQRAVFANQHITTTHGGAAR